MGRKKRKISPDAVYLVTNRTIDAKFFFLPTEEINRILLAALAYAQNKTQVKLFAFVFMANHFHLLLQSPRMNLNKFMSIFQGEVARRVNRYLGRKNGRVFASRYHDAVVKPDALSSKYHYIHNNPGNADLAIHPSDYVGLMSWNWLVTGENYVGLRVDYTRLYNMRRKNPDTPREAAIEEYELELSIPEQWADEDPEKVRERLRKGIEAEAERLQRVREQEGRTVMSAEEMLAQSWEDSPKEPKETKRRVLCITASPEVRRQHIEEHRRMEQAYLRAVRRMRQGRKRPGFPVGTFPPGWSRCVRPGDAWAAAPPPPPNCEHGEDAAAADMAA